MAEATDVVTTEAPEEASSAGEMPAMEAPEVPSKPTLAEEIAARTTELNKAMQDAGLATKRVPPSMKALKREAASATEKPADTPKAPEKTEAPKPGPAAADETPQEKQAKLSAGFAKLARQQRAAEAREAAVKAEEARVRAEAQRVTDERDSWKRENAQKLEELALLDANELQFLEAVAKRKGLTVQAAYDRITRGMIEGGGSAAPVDLVTDLQKQLAELKDQQGKERDDRTKAEEAAKEAAAKAEREREAAAVQERERRGFVTWVREGEFKEGPAKDAFPLLAQEPPEDIARVAWDVSIDFIQRQHAANEARARAGKPAASVTAPTFEMVADHLEKQLRYAVYLEQQKKPAATATASKAVTPPVATEPKKTAKPEPKAEATIVAKPKPVTPNTLTHSVASLRTGAIRGPRSEAQRLDDAVALWSSNRK